MQCISTPTRPLRLDLMSMNAPDIVNSAARSYVKPTADTIILKHLLERSKKISGVSFVFVTCSRLGSDTFESSGPPVSLKA